MTPKELFSSIRTRMLFHLYVSRTPDPAKEIVKRSASLAIEEESLTSLAYWAQWSEMLESEAEETMLAIGTPEHRGSFSQAWEKGRSVRRKWVKKHDDWEPG